MFTLGRLATLEINALDEKLIQSVKEEFQDYRLKIMFSKKQILIYKDHMLCFVITEANHSEIVYKQIDEFTNSSTKMILWITEPIEEDELKRLLQMNLDGYLYYKMSQAEIQNAIHFILRGKRYIHYHFTSTLIKDYVQLMNVRKKPNDVLSNREFEILGFVVKGYTVNQIAEKLDISSSTVNNHMAKVLQKLQVPDKTNAVLVAIKKNWFVL